MDEREGRYTHAGGIVYRTTDGLVHYLLIRPKSGVQEWLLPKGHIEAGESEEEAAQREVLEETGVMAQSICPVGELEITVQRKPLRVRFFLMRWESEGSPHERRECRWFPYEEALQAITHPQSRELLEVAETARLRHQA